MAVVGGYDHELFLDEQTAEDPRYSCTICSKIFRKPHLTECCGQHFCESCLEKWLKKNNTCPNCREAGLQHFIDKSFKREMGALRMKCPHYKDGCTFELELGSLKQHFKSENGCDYALVRCPNDCSRSKKIQRKDLQNHIKNDCRLRVLDCKYCGKKGTLLFHGESCEEKTIHCSNGCGKMLKKKEMYNHERDCPLAKIDCPFKDAGCKFQPLRNKLQEHMETSVQDHLLYTAQALQKMKRKEKAVASLVDTVLENRECKLGTSNRKALKSVRSLLDADTYHLTENGEEISVIADVVSTWRHFLQVRRFSLRSYATSPFYLVDGYKMDLEFKLSAEDERYFKFESSLRVLNGEFDDMLAWPLKNSFELELLIEVDECLCDMENDFTPMETEEDSNGRSWLSLTRRLPICSECCSGRLLKRNSGEGREICATKDVICGYWAGSLLDDAGLAVTVYLHPHDHVKRRRISDQ